MTSRAETRWLLSAAALVCAFALATPSFAIGLEKKPKPPGDPATEQQSASQAGGAPVMREAERPEPSADRPVVSVRRPTPSERIAAEERKHLKRMAQINRIQAVGIESENERLLELARELRDKETERHELALKRLERTQSSEGSR